MAGGKGGIMSPSFLIFPRRRCAGWLCVLAAPVLALVSCGRKAPAVAAAGATPAPVTGDWPMWGGSPSRNMVSSGRNAPLDFKPGKKVKGTDEIDGKTTEGLKWTVRLGSQSLGALVVSGGRVILGTNNENPRNPKYAGDRAIVLCLDERTGAFLWQMPGTMLPTGMVNDYPGTGMRCSFAVEGDRVYAATNRCEVVCLDLQGMANGNQGFQGESGYYARWQEPEVPVGATDADVIWRFDMRDEIGTFPHGVPMAGSSVLLQGHRVYASTGNGVDWTHLNVPAPAAPALICLDKAGGTLIGEEQSGISSRLFHCSLSSPALADAGGRQQIIYGAGDGFCYGFDVPFTKDKEGWPVFKELWRCDANPEAYREEAAGKRLVDGRKSGACEIISTPVVHGGRIYTVIGQDYEHGEGAGCLTCLDLSGKPVWRCTEVGRSLSTPSIADGIVYAADFAGRVHALDAATGARLWVYDTKGRIWGGTLLVDGMIYAGNEEGELHLISGGRSGGKPVRVVEFPSVIYTSPVYANGTLYVQTMDRLYAFAR